MSNFYVEFDALVRNSVIMQGLNEFDHLSIEPYRALYVIREVLL